MDPIIRAAAVSGETRRLGQAPRRQEPRSKPAPPPAAAPAQPTMASMVSVSAPIAPRTAAAPAPAPIVQAIVAEPAGPPAAELAAQASERERQRLADVAAREAEALANAERRGYLQGQEKAAAETKAELAALSALVANLTQTRHTLLAEQEDMLVDIAYTAACRIIGEHGITRAGITAMVNRLVQAAGGADQICVRMHPQDIDVLQAHEGLLDARLLLQGDAAVEFGGCIVETARGTLDARLDTQLERLREVLREVRQTHRQAESRL
ncbi:FliH/SctL family protein [Janthinobacterium sp. GB4P2]|uniref:FliH/SctL family protein n=1 Tax=Janthinobacterium sp. GB4P2 TaxID=3424189 RepID=UPI003F28664B